MLNCQGQSWEKSVGRRSEASMPDTTSAYAGWSRSFTHAGSSRNAAHAFSRAADVREREHVGEARQPRSDEVAAEEHGVHAEPAEDRELAARLEHLDLLAAGGLARAPVGSQLEDAGRSGGLARGLLDPGLRGHGADQRRVAALVGRIRRRQPEERRGGLAEVGIRGEARLEGQQRLGVLVRQQQVQRRAVAAEAHGEGTDRRHARPTESRNERVLRVRREARLQRSVA
jgi:hypothetical protein